MPDPSPTPALDALVREVFDVMHDISGQSRVDSVATAITAALPEIVRERIAGMRKEPLFVHRIRKRYEDAIRNHLRCMKALNDYTEMRDTVGSSHAEWGAKHYAKEAEGLFNDLCLFIKADPLADLIAATMGGE